MSKILKALQASLAIFVFAVVSIGTVVASADPWWKSKNSKPKTMTAAELLDKMMDREGSQFEQQLKNSCAHLAAQTQAKVAEATQAAAQKAEALRQRFQLQDDDDGLESMPAAKPDSNPMDTLLELPFTAHRAGVRLEDLPSPSAQMLDPVKTEEAKLKGQRALLEAVDEALNGILEVRSTDDEYVRKFIQGGGFIPKYAIKDRDLYNRCRNALMIGEVSRCSELYRKLFADTEIAYFRIVYSGKRLQELFAQMTHASTRTDISDADKQNLLKELRADYAYANLIRKDGLQVFGRNFAEYMLIRSFFEKRTEELAQYVGKQMNPPKAFANQKEVREFLDRNSLEGNSDFAQFISQKAHLWPTPPVSAGKEVPAAWEVDTQLSQVVPDSQRREFLLKAIKGAKLLFPLETQSKFNIIEKILVADKVYESAQGDLAENASAVHTEKKLHNFPTDHIAYIEKAIARFQVDEAYKTNLLSTVKVLLVRPTRQQITALFQNPKFNVIFEKSIAEHRLRLEKSGNAAMAALGAIEPIIGLVDQLPTDSARKAAVVKVLKKLLGITKKLEYIRLYAGEIDALGNIPNETKDPKVQLWFLLKMNAKWNGSRGNNDDFLNAAAGAFEFRDHWVQIKNYVGEMATSSKNPQAVKDQYLNVWERMNAATAQATIDGDYSITLKPTKLQIAHAVAGTAASIAGILAGGFGAVKALSFGVAATKWVIAALLVLGDNGIYLANQYLHKPLPDISPFFK